MIDFNKKFNWIEAWSSKHLKYILKIIIPYVVVTLIITFFIKKYLISHKKKDEDLNKRIFLLISTSFLCLLSFFLVFPNLSLWVFIFNYIYFAYYYVDAKRQLIF